jgi:hypothetical protein
MQLAADLDAVAADLEGGPEPDITSHQPHRDGAGDD